MDMKKVVPRVGAVAAVIIAGVYFTGQNTSPSITTQVHVIPANDIKAINQFYDEKSADQLTLAKSKELKLKYVSPQNMEELISAKIVQLNKSKSNEWSALFETADKELYLVPINSFTGIIINEKKIEGVISASDSYYLLFSRA